MKGSQYRLADSQWSDIRNMDFNVPNALSKRDGYTSMVSTGTSGPINSLYEFEQTTGASYLVAGSDTGLFYLSAGTFNELGGGYSSGQPFDYETFQDRLWACNGETFLSWTGSSLYPYMMPCMGITTFDNDGTDNAAFLSVGGTFVQVFLALSYLRSDGYEGPLSNIAPKVTLDLQTGPSFIATNGFNTSQAGATAIGVYLYAYGVSFNGASVAGVSIGVESMRFITYIPTSGLGDTITIGAADFQFPDVYDGNALTAAIGFSGQPFCFTGTYTPKYIELLNNRIYMAGFSFAPSDFAFTNINEFGQAEPEIVLPESIFPVNTNDGDRITGIKTFQNQMIIFKKDSFHRFLGDEENPETLQLIENSRRYGCLSNKTIVEYNNKLLFLDKEGIVEYNGADWRIISQLVEPTFRRMNISAALENAVAEHNELRNQIWFGIPVDGSTENNLTVVYDYLLNAWTFFDGFNASSFALAKQDIDRERMWFGDQSGMIHHFSPSFYADNGSGMTCLAFGKFDAPDGNNVQNMFRQLFVDVNEASGVTGQIDVEVYRNYDESTIKATFSVFQNQFQTRKDFGVQGKSSAYKFIHNSASLPLTLYGYTVKRRYLRDV